VGQGRPITTSRQRSIDVPQVRIVLGVLFYGKRDRAPPTDLLRWGLKPEAVARPVGVDTAPSIGPPVVASALAAERAHIYEVVGEALGHFRNPLGRRISRCHCLCNRLRSFVNLKSSVLF
jgi:hypothetical protein